MRRYAVSCAERIDGMINILRTGVASTPGGTPARALIINASSIATVDLQAHLLETGTVVVGVAYSSDEARRLIDDFRPDILFVDILFAENDRIIGDLRSVVERHGLPVVYVAASIGKDAISRLKSIGPCGFISWPYDSREIVSAVQLAVEKTKYERRNNTLHLEELRLNTRDAECTASPAPPGEE